LYKHINILQVDKQFLHHFPDPLDMQKFSEAVADLPLVLRATNPFYPAYSQAEM